MQHKPRFEDLPSPSLRGGRLVNVVWLIVGPLLLGSGPRGKLPRLNSFVVSGF